MSERGNDATGTVRPAWPHASPLIHGDDDPLLPHLAACFPKARLVCIAVAFVLDQGVDLIRPFLVDLLANGGELRLLTGDYFDVLRWRHAGARQRDRVRGGADVPSGGSAC